MSAKEKKTAVNSPIAKSFKSPLFLAIAICFSVMFVAALITTFTQSLGILAILAIIFSGVSTLCAWLLYATEFGNGKLKNLRLYIAYRKIMTTIAIIFVSIIGAVLVVGCIALTLMGDIIKNDIVPMLEQDIKPMLEDIVSSADQLDQAMADIDELYDEMPQEFKDMYGIESAEELEALIVDFADIAETALDAWDDIIDALTSDFATITVIVALVYVFAIVGMVFVSGSFKKTSKYLKALSKGNPKNKKPPFIRSFIGGAFIAIAGFACFAIDVMFAISALALAATVILFALFFKKMDEAADDEVLVAEGAEASVIADAATAEEPAIEEPAIEEPAIEEPAIEEPAAEEPAAEDPAAEDPAAEEPAADAGVEQ